MVVADGGRMVVADGGRMVVADGGHGDGHVADGDGATVLAAGCARAGAGKRFVSGWQCWRGYGRGTR
jgi:hypothetical protein